MHYHSLMVLGSVAPTALWLGTTAYTTFLIYAQILGFNPY